MTENQIHCIYCLTQPEGHSNTPTHVYKELVQQLKSILIIDVFFAVSDTDNYLEKENLSSSNRRWNYDHLITSSDALPLSYRRLVGAKAIKLGSWDKHPAYC